MAKRKNKIRGHWVRFDDLQACSQRVDPKSFFLSYYVVSVRVNALERESLKAVWPTEIFVKRRLATLAVEIAEVLGNPRAERPPCLAHIAGATRGAPDPVDPSCG